MEQNNKHYYKIDVPGHHGYSFMTVCNDEIDELEVLHRAFLCDLFTDADDVKYATVDDLVTKYDIEAFKNCTYDI
jgi:hypothetical protein